MNLTVGRDVKVPVEIAGHMRFAQVITFPSHPLVKEPLRQIANSRSRGYKLPSSTVPRNSQRGNCLEHCPADAFVCTVNPSLPKGTQEFGRPEVSGVRLLSQ